MGHKWDEQMEIETKRQTDRQTIIPWVHVHIMTHVELILFNYLYGFEE